MPAIDIIIVFILVLVPPFLLAGRIRVSPSMQSLIQAVLLLLLPFCIMLGLYMLQIPIRRDTLIYAHGALLGITIAMSFRQFSKRPFRDMLHPGLLLVAILLFPYTRLTGIDTYKWQDLATAIRMDQTIPWLIHPVGLFGFLPRSYPSLQPTLLASIQIMGNLGVEGGFRILSVLTLYVGFTTSRGWFTRFLNTRDAALCAFAYVLAPVFVRYTHWATGRGIFLALFPALLCLLTQSTDDAKPEHTGLQTGMRWLGIILLGFLLVLSHKAAWIALPLLLISHIGYRAVPTRWSYKAMLLLPFFLVGVLISHTAIIPGFPGKLFGASWIMLARFAWIIPIATTAWLLESKPPLVRRMPLAHLAFLPCTALAFDPQMYGALIALPFMVAFALPPILQSVRKTQSAYRPYFAIALALLLVASASAVVIRRSAKATTADVKAAAQFLNQHDPTGPFLIHAPAPERPRIQAYTDGCPRFVLTGNPQWRITIPPKPQVTIRQPHQALFAWTGWLRYIVTITGLEVQWYGDAQTNYHFEIAGRGNIPPQARLIYQNPTVRVYTD